MDMDWSQDTWERATVDSSWIPDESDQLARELEDSMEQEACRENASNRDRKRTMDVEASDIVYIGPIRVCGTCDAESNWPNPLYRCDIMADLNLGARRFWPWARYSKKRP